MKLTDYELSILDEDRREEILIELEKAEMWDKYSDQFKTALQIYTDCKTTEEFFIKNQLPKFITTITNHAKHSMENVKK